MNSWIVQGSGDTFCVDWYLDEYARFNFNEPDWWIIYKKHVDLIKKDDIVYIWKAQTEPRKKLKPEYYDWKESIGRTENICGIIAVGRIVSGPEPYYSSQEEMDKFKKYRVVDKYNFDSSPNGITYKIECVYDKPENIRVRKPLLQEIIWQKLGQSPDTELGVFNYKRHGTRSVKLETWESDVIRSLLGI